MEMRSRFVTDFLPVLKQGESPDGVRIIEATFRKHSKMCFMSRMAVAEAMSHRRGIHMRCELMKSCAALLKAHGIPHLWAFGNVLLPNGSKFILLRRSI